MGNIRISALAVAAACCALAGSGAAKTTKPPAYVGTWATSLTECKAATDKQGAPAVFGEKEFTQFDTHCSWDQIVWRRYAWHARASCTAAGNKQDDTLEIAVSGDALALTWDSSKATIDYARCK